MKASINISLIIGAVLLCSCQSMYYDTMEKFGVHKREILVDRVEEARESQEEAKEQFESTFDEFLAVSGVEVSELKNAYDRLSDSYERSESHAEEVRERIASIESVSNALFEEWEEELDQYSRSELREVSAEQLRETREQASVLISAMNSAASKMDPVLDAFRDQVLFLKHNLNARAIAALSETSIELREEVEVLIRQMQASIDEANEFIAQMKVSAE